MELTRYEYAKACLAVFSFGILQDSVNVLRKMSESEITIEELTEYVFENQKIIAESEARHSIEYQAMARYCFCPECKSGLTMEELGGPDNRSIISNENGLPYLSVATCKDEAICGWQKFWHEPLFHLIRSFFPENIKAAIDGFAPHGIHGSMEDTE